MQPTLGKRRIPLLGPKLSLIGRGSDAMNLRCSACQLSYPLDTREWVCQCGGILALDGSPPFSAQSIVEGETTMWRYRGMLPVEGADHITSLLEQAIWLE